MLGPASHPVYLAVTELPENGGDALKVMGIIEELVATMLFIWGPAALPATGFPHSLKRTSRVLLVYDDSV